MVTENRKRVVNGKIYYINANVMEQAMEIWGAHDSFFKSIPYGPNCEKQINKALKEQSEKEEETVC